MLSVLVAAGVLIFKAKNHKANIIMSIIRNWWEWINNWDWNKKITVLEKWAKYEWPAKYNSFLFLLLRNVYLLLIFSRLCLRFRHRREDSSSSRVSFIKATQLFCFTNLMWLFTLWLLYTEKENKVFLRFGTFHSVIRNNLQKNRSNPYKNLYLLTIYFLNKTHRTWTWAK